MRLKDGVVLITGGLNGLGREAVLVFARESARAAVCHLRPEGGEIVAAIESMGGQGFYAAADVSQSDPGCVEVRLLGGA